MTFSEDTTRVLLVNVIEPNEADKAYMKAYMQAADEFFADPDRVKNMPRYQGGERYVCHFDRIAIPMFTGELGRRLRKRKRALKNAHRPGLSARRRKYWLNVSRRVSPSFFETPVYRECGAGVYNPEAVSRVRIIE